MADSKNTKSTENQKNQKGKKSYKNTQKQSHTQEATKYETIFFLNKLFFLKKKTCKNFVKFPIQMQKCCDTKEPWSRKR